MKIVTAALILDANNVLVARRAPGEKLEGLWEFPGGKVEDGESLQECLHRELREELNLISEVGDVFTESEYHYGHGSIRLIALFANIVSGEPLLTVHDELRWVAIEELLDLPLAPADIPIAHALNRRFNALRS